jgi:hypothetical protein
MYSFPYKAKIGRQDLRKSSYFETRITEIADEKTAYYEVRLYCILCCNYVNPVNSENQEKSIKRRCPTRSPLATCGEWQFKCGN